MRKSISRLLLGLLVPACALTPVPSLQPAVQKGSQGGIHVQTNFVTVIASALDADGRPIIDLPKDSFQILEEGVPQQIERFEAETNQPLDLALMVDTSL